jgi:hypothetical protein
VAEGGVSSLPRRVRHQDGACPPPCLAARRAQRGAVPRVGVALGGAPQLRAARDRARAAGVRGGGSGGVRPGAAGGTRASSIWGS